MKKIHSSCEECRFITEQKQELFGKVETVYFCTKHGFDVNKNEWCPEGRLAKKNK